MYRRRKVVKEDKPPIPTTIAKFGYVIKDNGEIRHEDTGKKKNRTWPSSLTNRHIPLDESYEFDYLVKDRAYNEERYKIFISTSITHLNCWHGCTKDYFK